jgi:hypothetical protein
MARLTTAGITLGLLTAVSCGPPPTQAGSGDDFEVKWDDTSDSGSGSSSDSGGVEGLDDDGGGTEAATATPGTEGLDSDQKAQIEVALRRGGDKAAQCPAVVPDSPTGTGDVQVLFDGVKGRAVDAEVGPPFSGTPVEACIKRAFVDEIVLPFDGGPIKVPTTVVLEKKK